MRSIRKIHKAVYEPIADLVTYRVMPTQSFPMNALDPFIFLNHHGKQEYLPKNHGLPFGPHPHRGFETVTIILEGDLTHKDSSGSNSVIRTGGVQWMTAGSGIIHAEVSSDEFKLKGGPLEILQLWINLPARAKMTAPHYTGLQKEEIPRVEMDDNKVTAHIVSGSMNGVQGALKPITDIHLTWFEFEEDGSIKMLVPRDKNIFLYVAAGEVNVNGHDVAQHHLPEFNNDDEEITIKANLTAIVVFGYATPFNEPFAAYGPFVMNSEEEIMAAYDDYNKGKFGNPEALMEN
ncbi:MAG TPA: pirin family protein [Flavitalea sp.]|nr:pirin family protein [Flavitalea sp.]